MTILGIDPGFSVTGFGILRTQQNGTVLLIDYGDLSMSSSKTLVERVGIFHDVLNEKIVRWQVSNLALETPFLGKNSQTFLKLGYLRGILYLLAHRYQIVLHEFSPREVKQAVTGFGGADKEQVARVIMQLFPRIKACPELNKKAEKQDVTDALAITLCGLWRGTQRAL